MLSPCWTLGPFESTRKHSPKCIQVELDHRDLLQEDEEFERQKLVAEIAEELRPQHPPPEAFNLICVMSKEEQSSHFNVVILKKLCVTLKYHSNPGKEKETKLTNFRLSYKIARAFLHQLRSEHRDP